MSEVIPNGKTIDSIVKGGAVAILGILLALTIWINYKTASNHIQHNTDAWNQNTQALTELKISIQQTNDIAETQVKAIELQANAIDNMVNAILLLRGR